MIQKQRNDYDDTKAFLNKIRKITKNTAQDIREQLENPKKIMDRGADVSNFGDPTQWQKDTRQDRNIGQEPTPPPAQQSSNTSTENSDYAVINNVEVVINSTDRADFKLKDEEKGQISQLIDDFRSEVSEITQFGKLSIYDDNAKLDGNIKDVNLGFTISAGDDNGVFLSNTSMLQVNDSSLGFIEKLKKFQPKFNDVMGQIIANRQQN